MKLHRTSGAIAAVGALGLILLFLLPIVPYSLSMQIPFDFKGPPTCTNQTQPGIPNCSYTLLYPPINITSRASLSYALFGIGIQPFNGSYRITGGNDSAIFYVTGTKITSAEDFNFHSFELNPEGVIAIDNTSVARDTFGLVNFTTTLTNVGAETLTLVSAGFTVPGNGDNFTQGGLTWISQGSIGGFCDTLSPGASCSLSFEALNESVGAGQKFDYRLEVRALSGSEGVVLQRWIQGVWPAKGVTPGWVSSFMQEVSGNRTGPNLVEDQSLDAFAALRFRTQVDNYSVSNYGFQSDFSATFGTSTRQIGEVTLWPGSDAPFEYVSFLQESAPGHWSALTNPDFTHFGYYIGYGPTIVVSQPCSVTEFPGNVNMTALLTSRGCQFHIEQAVWLVIEVGS
jgi:hypothetical protein